MREMNCNKDILDKCVLPNSELISWRAIDGEVIFLHKKERVFYELNKTASFIWEKASSKTPIRKIINSLSANYDIDRDAAEKDTLEWMEDLLNRKIFIVL